MENLLLSLNVVAPLFLLLALGYLLRCLHLMDEGFVAKCNALLFRIFLPVLVFASIYRSHIREIFDLGLVIYGAVGITAAFLLLYLLVPRFCRDKHIQGTIVQGSFRANCLIFGIPIATSLYGSNGIGATALIAVILIPLFNIFATVAFTDARGHIGAMLRSLATNPFIISAALGIIFVVFDIQLPEVIAETTYDVAAVASPLALIALGANFTFKVTKSYMKPLIATLAIKLLVLPGVLLPLGVCFGFTGTFFVALIAAFATPTSVTSYIVAAESGGEGELAGQMVVFSSVVSIFTIFLIVFAAKTLGIV